MPAGEKKTNPDASQAGPSGASAISLKHLAVFPIDVKALSERGLFAKDYERNMHGYCLNPHLVINDKPFYFQVDSWLSPAEQFLATLRNARKTKAPCAVTINDLVLDVNSPLLENEQAVEACFHQHQVYTSFFNDEVFWLKATPQEEDSLRSRVDRELFWQLHSGITLSVDEAIPLGTLRLVEQGGVRPHFSLMLENPGEKNKVLIENINANSKASQVEQLSSVLQQLIDELKSVPTRVALTSTHITTPLNIAISLGDAATTESTETDGKSENQQRLEAAINDSLLNGMFGITTTTAFMPTLEYDDVQDPQMLSYAILAKKIQGDPAFNAKFIENSDSIVLVASKAAESEARTSRFDLELGSEVWCHNPGAASSSATSSKSQQLASRIIERLNEANVADMGVYINGKRINIKVTQSGDKLLVKGDEVEASVAELAETLEPHLLSAKLDKYKLSELLPNPQQANSTTVAQVKNNGVLGCLNEVWAAHQLEKHLNHLMINGRRFFYNPLMLGDSVTQLLARITHKQQDGRVMLDSPITIVQINATRFTQAELQARLRQSDGLAALAESMRQAMVPQQLISTIVTMGHQSGFLNAGASNLDRQACNAWPVDTNKSISHYIPKLAGDARFYFYSQFDQSSGEFTELAFTSRKSIDAIDHHYDAAAGKKGSSTYHTYGTPCAALLDGQGITTDWDPTISGEMATKQCRLQLLSMYAVLDPDTNFYKSQASDLQVGVWQKAVLKTLGVQNPEQHLRLSTNPLRNNFMRQIDKALALLQDEAENKKAEIGNLKVQLSDAGRASMRSGPSTVNPTIQAVDDRSEDASNIAASYVQVSESRADLSAKIKAKAAKLEAITQLKENLVKIKYDVARAPEFEQADLTQAQERVKSHIDTIKSEDDVVRHVNGYKVTTKTHTLWQKLLEIFGFKSHTASLLETIKSDICHWQAPKAPAAVGKTLLEGLSDFGRYYSSATLHI